MKLLLGFGLERQQKVWHKIVLYQGAEIWNSRFQSKRFTWTYFSIISGAYTGDGLELQVQKSGMEYEYFDTTPWNNLNFENSFPASLSSGIHLYRADGRENIISVRVINNDIFTSGNNKFITHLPFSCIFIYLFAIKYITGLVDVSIWIVYSITSVISWVHRFFMLERM